MIRTFCVENFLSIKDRTVISFIASPLTDETSYENYFLNNKERILKGMAFYGSNATGKTNILLALETLSEIAIGITYPNKKPLPYYPFLLCGETKRKPTSFMIEFSLDDKSSNYRYSITYNSTLIINEKLEKQTSQKYSIVFDRNITNSRNFIYWGKEYASKALLNTLYHSLSPSKSYLSVFGMLNIKDLANAYRFFKECLFHITPQMNQSSNYDIKGLENNKQLQNFTLRLLKAADINITNFKFAKRKINTDIGDGYQADVNLLLEHSCDTNKFFIDFCCESLGTKKIFVIAQYLNQIFNKASILVVDEIESSFHPDLTKLILALFFDKTINKCNSQLVFTSHETSLLDLDLLRREQIQFVYKDKKTQGTFIKFLKDFHVRKTDDIAKSYLAGRYDTSPDINKHSIE